MVVVVVVVDPGAGHASVRGLQVRNRKNFSRGGLPVVLARTSSFRVVMMCLWPRAFSGTVIGMASPHAASAPVVTGTGSRWPFTRTGFLNALGVHPVTFVWLTQSWTKNVHVFWH